MKAGITPWPTCCRKFHQHEVHARKYNHSEKVNNPIFSILTTLRACSHEPGGGVMIAPGQALPRVHMMICCPGATLPQVNFIAPGQVHRHLITTNLCEFLSFYTDCYRKWILNTFTYFWCFLELFIGKFIPNIKNEHAQNCSCPGATFAFCSHGEKLPRQGGLPGVGQRVTRLSKLPQGNEKLMWIVTGVRPCTEAKLTPGSLSCPGAMSCPGIMWTGPKLSRCSQRKF